MCRRVFRSAVKRDPGLMVGPFKKVQSSAAQCSVIIQCSAIIHRSVSSVQQHPVHPYHPVQHHPVQHLHPVQCQLSVAASSASLSSCAVSAQCASLSSTSSSHYAPVQPYSFIPVAYRHCFPILQNELCLKQPPTHLTQMLGAHSASASKSKLVPSSEQRHHQHRAIQNPPNHTKSKIALFSITHRKRETKISPKAILKIVQFEMISRELEDFSNGRWCIGDGCVWN